MTRGFCTIATGDVKYSKLAYNLLMSYKIFTKKNYPFSVITDSKNEFLKDFDDVILVKDTEQTYLDKLSLFKLCPYDETIFIDADSLAYGDLCEIFKYFSEADDVSCIGEVFQEDAICGWFRKEDVGKYKEDIDYTIWMHGGIYFIRKTPRLSAFYDTCVDIAQNYKKYFFRFKYLIEPADEPIIALAMAIHKFKPIKGAPEIMAFYRDSKIKKIDIISGKLAYTVKLGSTENGLLIHWATANTTRALYCSEVKKLKWIIKKQAGKKNSLIEFFAKYNVYYYIFSLKDCKDDIQCFFRKAMRKSNGRKK